MIRNLFDGFLGNGGQVPVPAVLQPLVEIILPGTEQELTQDRFPPVPVFLLHQQTIPEIPTIPPVCQLIFRNLAPPPPEIARAPLIDQSRRMLIQIPRTP